MGVVRAISDVDTGGDGVFLVSLTISLFTSLTDVSPTVADP